MPRQNTALLPSVSFSGQGFRREGFVAAQHGYLSYLCWYSEQLAVIIQILW
ncbi:MAG: hypothetical protein KME08_16350 [Aphanothece sp. CMT-3BRIN-NPC111]|nr:hypothetical protein [Aphanothece sp. CMT-3BRIN-NPC111]